MSIVSLSVLSIVAKISEDILTRDKGKLPLNNLRMDSMMVRHI